MRFDRCPAVEDWPECWRLQDAGITAVMVPSAGMNLVSLEFRGAERLVLPLPLASFMKAAKTGGVPLLHPWANRLRGDRYDVEGTSVDLGGIEDLKRDGNDLPMHGLVLRRAEWEVSGIETAPTGTAAISGRMDWHDGMRDFAAFPFPHQVTVIWSLRRHQDRGIAVCCRYQVDAGDRPVPTAAGWHPYLRPSIGCDRTRIRLELPPVHGTTLDSRGLPVIDEDGRPLIRTVGDPSGTLDDRHLDDLFRGPDGGWTAAVIADGVRMELEADAGWPWLQVYAPQDSDFACIEPMLAPTAALSDGHPVMVEAGGRFEASFTLRIVDGSAG